MKRTENNLYDRIMKWVSFSFALVFMAIGVGVLTGVVLPGPRLLSPGVRWVSGGFILAYGIVRMVMIYVKNRKVEKADNSYHSK